MVRVQVYRCLRFLVLLALVNLVTSLIEETIHDVNNNLKNNGTRRAGRKKSRSTSSESGIMRSDDASGSGESLGLSASSSSSSSKESTKNRYKPKSSEERKGWRKWHRKCPPCPGDMTKKWRDRSIKWICGGYQRARRSFKSECMMYYRNCQDGTMFVKIHDYRCQNDTGKDLVRGRHFFYDYGKDSQDSDEDSRSDSSSAHFSSGLR